MPFSLYNHSYTGRRICVKYPQCFRTCKNPEICFAINNLINLSNLFHTPSRSQHGDKMKMMHVIFLRHLIYYRRISLRLVWSLNSGESFWRYSLLFFAHLCRLRRGLELRYYEWFFSETYFQSGISNLSIDAQIEGWWGTECCSRPLFPWMLV